MKKIWKKTAAIVAACCLALCGLIFAACGGDKQAEYSVSFTYQSGKPVPEAKVIFTPDAEGKETVEAVTDEEGKCTVRLYTDMDYSVAADSLPEDFILQTKKIHTTKGEEIELKLILPQTYSFEVTGPEDAPISNVTISYSATPTGEKKQIGRTGEDGKLFAKMEPVDGYAFITPPEGYVYNEDYTAKSPYIMSSLRPQLVSFELIRYGQLSFETAMSGEEISAFRSATENSVFENMMENSICEAYSFRKTSADAHRVYSFTAEEAGEYWLFVNYTGEYAFSVSDDLNLNADYALNSVSGSFNHFSVLCEEGTTYYLNVEADTTQQELQFVIVLLRKSNETLVTATGEVQLSVLKELPAEIRFMPSAAGKYTFSTQANVKIEVISNSFPVGSSENGAIDIEVTTGNLYYGDGTPSNVSWILRFTALGEEPVYPLNLTVNITREDIVEYTLQVKTAEVTETLAKFDNQPGTLTAIGVNNTDGQVVKGDDGKYHYGDKNGAVVVVQLTGEIPVFYPEIKFEEIDKERDFFRFFIGTDEEKHVYLYEDYAPFFHTYTGYVNKDGVYPLTDELVAFLKLVAKQNGSFFATCVESYTSDSLWLFSAFYYAE